MSWTDRPIRELAAADLTNCLALAQSRGWLAEEHKWRLLFAVGTVYGIDDPAGEGLAAVVVCTRYGPELAAIGMMLVAERHERQGLGARLMRHAAVQAGVATTWLNATEYGQPLYEKLGFRVVDHSTQYLGHWFGVAGGESRPVAEADLPEILAMDAEVFGSDRSDVLRRMAQFAERFRVVSSPEGVLGYGGAWRNVDNTVLGPVIANDGETARALLADLAANVVGPVRVDLEHQRPEQIEWAIEHGLHPGPTTAVMIQGADLPGDRSRLYNPLMVALG
jgi:GNAT superfamily N-acetyltransferase